MDRIALACSLLSLVTVGSSGCEKEDDDKDKGDPAPSSWLVGDDGEMRRVTEDGDLSAYPLELDEDLNAIACIGVASAWVVGDAGTMLLSRDAGSTWERIDLHVDADLRALAVAGHAPEGDEAVWVVGDAGTVLVTPDGGASWETIQAPSAAAFTGVATDGDGTFALASTSEGTIYRLEAGVSPVFAGTVPLHAIAMAHDASRAVAVGTGGTMLESLDAGASWAPLESSTRAELFAVRLASHGPDLVAAGAGGTLVRHDGTTASVQQLLPSDLALRGLHIGADGRSQAVGDQGTVLVSEDFGAHWATLATAGDATVRGVDDFHPGGHW